MRVISTFTFTYVPDPSDQRGVTTEAGGTSEALAEENLLRLNVSKCEIVLFSQNCNIDLPVCKVEGAVLPAGDVGKCLLYTH